jgi:hypothetical protein
MSVWSLESGKNHWVTPYHNASHEVVGINLPLPMFVGSELAKDFGYSPYERTCPLSFSWRFEMVHDGS